MSGFTPAWLDLREAADSAARAAGLIRLIGARRPLHILDLGAGTGANLRYLAPRLGGEQHWLLLDHDERLLAVAESRLRRWARALDGEAVQRGEALCLSWPGGGAIVRRQPIDLATAGPALPIPPGGLVTAAALLDLVSESWLRSLAASCRRAGAAALFALSYDGRTQHRPADELDARVTALFNAHQRCDKGFGSALGPAAASRAESLFAEQEYRVRGEASDWLLDARAGALQEALVEGWFAAARELVSGAEVRALTAWLARRRAAIAAGRSRLVVGHRDMVAVPVSVSG